MENPRTDNTLIPVPEISQSWASGQWDRDHPSRLRVDQYAYGKNVEIRNAGEIYTRRGYTQRVAGPGVSPQGACWLEPTGVTGMIVQVNEGKVFYWRKGDASWTRVDAAVVLNNTANPVRLVVLNGVLYIFSGALDDVYSWDGSAATLTDEGTGDTNPPLCDLATVQAGRIVAAGTATLTDYVYFSDIYDGHTWAQTANSIRLPTDGSEKTTAVATYRKGDILAFTRNSTHMVTVSAAAVSGFTRATLDPRVGCIADRSVVVVSDDAFFMSADGHIRTIKRTVQDIAFGVSLPITHGNPTLIGRIYKRYASRAAGVYFDNYYLVSVPFDSSTVNSGVIAFDTLHQIQTDAGVVPACVGEWTGLAVNEWVVTNFASTRELYFIEEGTGDACQMFEGATDNGDEISVEIQFRGMDWQQPRIDKTIHSGEIQFINSQGTGVISYARDDQSFTQLLTKLVQDPDGAFLPISLPFTLPGSAVFTVPLTFYRIGRSRAWQIKIVFTGPALKIKHILLNAWLENLVTR